MHAWEVDPVGSGKNQEIWIKQKVEMWLGDSLMPRSHWAVVLPALVTVPWSPGIRCVRVAWPPGKLLSPVVTCVGTKVWA
jgi:hypothetical protein